MITFVAVAQHTAVASVAAIAVEAVVAMTLIVLHSCLSVICLKSAKGQYARNH